MRAECCICVAPVSEQSGNPEDGVQHPVATRCGHLFHSNCLSRWLKHKSVCPCCKKTCRARSDVFRIYLDSSGPDASCAGEASGTGAPDDPLDLGGGSGSSDAVGGAPSIQISQLKRRCEMLEAEVTATNAGVLQARREQSAAAAEASRHCAELERLQKEFEDATTLHNHDRDEAHRWKREHSALHKSHLALQQEYTRIRDAENVRGRAAALATGEEVYNPAVDKPEVLKLFNINLKKQKDEYKRQVTELASQLSAARSQAEAAEQKAARRREKMESVMAAHLAAKAERARQQQVEQELRAGLECRCAAAEAKALSGQIPARSGDRLGASPASIASTEQDQWARALAAEEESDTSGVFSIPESPEQQKRLPPESTHVIDEGWPVQRRQKRPRFGDEIRPVSNTKKISWSSSTRQGRGTKGTTSRCSTSKAVMLSRSGPRIDSFFLNQRR